jgi:signal transduction histidine kinase
MPKPALLEKPMKNGGVFRPGAETPDRADDGQTLLRRLGEAINQAATLEELFRCAAEAVRGVWPDHALSLALRNAEATFVRTQFISCQGRIFTPAAQMPFRRFCRALRLAEGRRYSDYVPEELWPLLFPNLAEASSTNEAAIDKHVAALEALSPLAKPLQRLQKYLPSGERRRDSNGAASQPLIKVAEGGPIELMEQQSGLSALLVPLRDLSAPSSDIISPSSWPGLQGRRKMNFRHHTVGTEKGEFMLGCLAIVSLRAKAFAPHHSAWLVTLADLLAAGIQKVQLLQQRERQRHGFQQLAEIGEEMGTAMDLNTALQKIVEGAIRLAPVPVAAVTIVELTALGDLERSAIAYADEKGSVAAKARPPAATNENAPALDAALADWPRFPLRPTRGLAKRLQRHQPLVVYDVAKSRIFSEAAKAKLAQHDIRSYFGMPILFEPPAGQDANAYTTPLALLSLYAHGPHEFDGIDAARLRVFFATAAQVLAKVRLRHRLDNEKACFDGVRSSAMEELENFVYVISHNLKTPVVSIQGFANILQEEVGPALEVEHQHFLERIQKNAAAMEKMVLDLLEFSRLGRKPIKLEPVNVRELAQSVIDEMCWRGPGSGVEFVFPSQPAEPPRLLADGAELKIVFDNLISNAVKYRRSEAPLRIEIGWEEQPRFHVFWVRDNGMGMEPAFQAKAFDLFQRGPNVGQVAGTGVGLAIVRRIVENHRGLVRLHSKPGEGTAVYFTLPKLEAAPSGEQAEPALLR